MGWDLISFRSPSPVAIYTSVTIAGCLENEGRKRRMICLCDPYFQVKHLLKHWSSCHPCCGILVGYEALETAEADTQSSPCLKCHLQIRKPRPGKEKGHAKIKGRMRMRTRRL